jgi:hypothetical protein
MATQKASAEEIVARLRSVDAPASKGFFMWVARKLDSEANCNRIMSDPQEIVTMICRAWTLVDNHQLLPEVDLWPFIEAITPEDLQLTAKGFWFLVCGARRELRGETGR